MQSGDLGGLVGRESDPDEPPDPAGIHVFFEFSNRGEA
jgi:hypothetical protein